MEYGLYCKQADFPPYVILEFHILINNERLVRGGEGAEHIAPYIRRIQISENYKNNINKTSESQILAC